MAEIRTRKGEGLFLNRRLLGFPHSVGSSKGGVFSGAFCHTVL